MIQELRWKTIGFLVYSFIATPGSALRRSIDPSWFNPTLLLSQLHSPISSPLAIDPPCRSSQRQVSHQIKPSEQTGLRNRLVAGGIDARNATVPLRLAVNCNPSATSP